MVHDPTPSLRGNKYHENVHRPQGTNLIGTLDHNGGWVPNGAAFAPLNLDAALNHAMGPLGHSPLLWAYVGDALTWRVKFGFDEFVPVIPPGGVPPAMPPLPGAPRTKIGHVALENQAIISGEIVPDPATPGGWYLDNNSGAWGAMDNRDGKSTMLTQVASAITAADAFANAPAAGIVCRAKTAYSRRVLKRYFQQTNIYERLFRA